jgi:hypothetical protein
VFYFIAPRSCFYNRNGSFKGINVRNSCYVTHLLFSDDILILYEGYRRVVEKLKEIINLFCMVIGMKINITKLTISLWGISKREKNIITQLFPYNVVEIDDGLKYLGFELKTNIYKNGHWKWLISKVERKLNTSCN